MPESIIDMTILPETTRGGKCVFRALEIPNGCLPRGSRTTYREIGSVEV